MNEHDLAAIEARANAATPGPWDTGYPDGYGHWIDDNHEIWQVGVPAYDLNGKIAGNYDYELGGIVHASDAVFIAAARTDVPALLAEVRRLRAGLAGLHPEHHGAREEECSGRYGGWCSCGVDDLVAQIEVLLK